MMDLGPSFLYFTLTITCLSFICAIIRCYSKPSRKTPCPESYPLVGNLIGFLHNRHRFHDWVADMLSATPSLTLQVNGFLGLSHRICTADLVNIDHLLRSNFHNYVKGTLFQSVFCDLLGDGIFNVDGELWFAQRKVASLEFSTKSLKEFISKTVQFQLSKRLIPYLSSACISQEIINLEDVLRRFAFDNICNVAFGVDPAWLESSMTDQSSASSSFVHAFDFAVEVCFNRFISPLPVIWRIKRLLNIGREKQYKEAIRIINGYVTNIINSKERNFQDKKTGEQEENDDLLSRFMFTASNLELKDPESQRKFLRDIVVSFILAGKDSTSTALTWFFWLIAGHPRCENLILNELTACSPVNCTESFNYDELKKLNYLHAALSESLRLFPPVPINSRLSTLDDILPSGTCVRKGWFADYSAYAMGRMERLWGADCREFRPERWLDDNGVFQPCDQFKFPVFHCGPRMCLGKEMAYMQMKSVVSSIMREFKIFPVDGGGTPERMVNPPYSLSLILKMKGGLPVMLKRR